MSITVDTFFSKAAPKLFGTSLNAVEDENQNLREAAFQMLLHIDPSSTIRKARIENALYDKIYNYTAPSNLKGDKIIDIRPVVIEHAERNPITQTYMQEFDAYKRNNKITVEEINEQKTLRINMELETRNVLHRLDSTSVGGTITATGDASTPTANQLDYVAGSASLQFNLDGNTGQGIIRVALDQEQDLSDEEDLGALFDWIKFPDVSRLTNRKLRWGSGGLDSGNYWEQTVTSAHDRDWEDNAWTLQRYDWVDASETGSPDASKVNWIELEFNYSTGGAINNVKIDNITSSLGEAWEVIYYANTLFKSSAGSYLTTPTDGSDTILVDEGTENILLWEFAKSVNAEVKGAKAKSIIQDIDLVLHGHPTSNRQDLRKGLYDLHKEQYPSQGMIKITTTYEFGDFDGDGDYNW